MQIYDIEQRTPEWHALRMGVPTASDFNKAITPKQGKPSTQAAPYAAKLALEMYLQKPCEDFGGTEWMDRGVGLEGEAIAQYEMINNLDVEQVGFVLDDVGRGCSPDGLVGDAGMVEVKCLKPENHVAAMLSYDETHKCDAKYFAQTQGQMLIAGRQWCDLIFFSPGLPLLVIRQMPDEKYCENLNSALGLILEYRDRALGLLRTQTEGKDTA
jgi:hypothetical protein